MTVFEFFLIAVGLSMDAFAVSVCKGLEYGKPGVRAPLAAGLYFGGFQALMPVIGYFAGVSFEKYIRSFDHWIAFSLLVIIGGGMLIGAIRGGEEKVGGGLGPKVMIPLAVATSIDALAVGISIALLSADILTGAVIIGVTAAVISAAGVLIGSVFGAKFRRPAQIAGGIVLIGIGLKILLEHLTGGA